MIGRFLRTTLVVGGISLAGSQLSAQDRNSEGLHPDDPNYRDHFDTSKDAWREQRWRFPPFPSDSKLIRFEVPDSNFTHYLDPESMSFGRDEVFRYTVILEAAGGGRNVFYEAMRCATREYRSIGYGTKAGGFRPRSTSNWHKMTPSEASGSRFRWVLWDRIFCDESGNYRDVKEVVVRLGGR